ncbi:hypothetical protein PIB30_079066, partial [Stylosanthes scabra]|nr:hypothetical protein [Stylosanthes scabra]
PLSYGLPTYRNQPIKDSSSSGLLKTSKDGNLVLMNSNNSVVLWSIKASNVSSNTVVAKLLNTGNLVLQENSIGRILRQSFQHHTNAYLQKMEFSIGSVNGERIQLTSWRSPQDPSMDSFRRVLNA